MIAGGISRRSPRSTPLDQWDGGTALFPYRRRQQRFGLPCGLNKRRLLRRALSEAAFVGVFALVAEVAEFVAGRSVQPRPR